MFGLIKNNSYFIGKCLCVLLFTGTASAKQNQISDYKELKQAYDLLFTQVIKRNNHSYRAKPRLPQYTNARERAILYAKKQLRKKYRWGGTSPITGFDCSGLTQYAFKIARVDIPRTANAQYRHTKRVSLSKLQAGDLIFFHTRRTRAKVNHVGLYLGDGKFIHAPRTGRTVSIEKFKGYWRRKAVGAGRV